MKQLHLELLIFSSPSKKKEKKTKNDRYVVRQVSHLSMEVRDSKTSSSHGIVRPFSWSKPNSSSAWWRSVWNSGRLRKEIGTIYLLLFSPTYTTKWPFGTSKRPWSSFLPKLEHLLRICLMSAVWGSLLDFLKAIIIVDCGWRVEEAWERRESFKEFAVKGKRECGGYLSIALGSKR